MPFAAAVGSPLQWVFDRTAATGLERGQYLAVSISGADAMMDLPAEELKSELSASLAGSAARGARGGGGAFPGHARAPGDVSAGARIGRLRPGPRTPVSRLFLAGAWTATGWPATMEGAVRSGTSAASCALAAVEMQVQSQSLGVSGMKHAPSMSTMPPARTATPEQLERHRALIDAGLRAAVEASAAV